MTAGAPLPDLASAASAVGPLPSRPAFASADRQDRNRQCNWHSPHLFEAWFAVLQARASTSALSERRAYVELANHIEGVDIALGGGSAS